MREGGELWMIWAMWETSDLGNHVRVAVVDRRVREWPKDGMDQEKRTIISERPLSEGLPRRRGWVRVSTRLESCTWTTLVSRGQFPDSGREIDGQREPRSTTVFWKLSERSSASRLLSTCCHAEWRLRYPRSQCRRFRPGGSLRLLHGGCRSSRPPSWCRCLLPPSSLTPSDFGDDSAPGGLPCLLGVDVYGCGGRRSSRTS